jgi:hypothetical protein
VEPPATESLWQQGRGYARELAAAGLEAAAVDPTEPLTRGHARNQPSRRVAEHVGLADRGLRIDANDGRACLALADRVLDPERFPFADPALISTVCVRQPRSRVERLGRHQRGTNTNTMTRTERIDEFQQRHRSVGVPLATV